MENKYQWDLDYLLNGKSLEELFEDFQSKKQEVISIFSNFLDNETNFKNWIKRNEELTVLANRLYNYVSNNLNINVADPKWNSWMQKVSGAFYELTSAISSHDSQVLQNEAKIKEFLKSSDLVGYAKRYDEIFRYKPYTLNERESKLYSTLTRQDDGFATIFSVYTNSDLKFADAYDSNNKKYPIKNEAQAYVLLKNKDRKLRETAFKSMYKAYHGSKSTITNMLYFNYLSLNQQAKARNYEDYIHRAAFDDSVDKNLISHIYSEVKKFKPSYEEYKKVRDSYLKKLIGVTKIKPWDNALPLIDKKIEFSIEEAQELAVESLSVLGEEYKNHIQRSFDERWISWLPQPGKRGGAYSIGGTKGIEKYFILMNYNKGLRDVQTLVHELGHSMHSLYSNKNQTIYSDYKIFWAEIASISNEVYLNYYLLKKYDNKPEMKLMILDEMISSFFASTTRQVIFSNFEWIANDLINKGLPFTDQVVISEYEKLNYEYTGKPISKNLESDEALASITPLRIPHFYMGNFYVYKYSIGQVGATIAAHRVYNKVEGAKEKVFKFLSSGGSLDSLETIKQLDIDLTSSAAWEEAHSILKQWIEEFKKVVKLLLKKKRDN